MEHEILKQITDVEADNMLSDLKDLQADKERFEMIAKARIDRIRNDLNLKAKNIDSSTQFIKSQLQAYFLIVPKKATKTQMTYSLLSGKLIMKKPTIKIQHDDKKILEWAKDNASEYVKQEPKLEWSKMKADLEIDGTTLVNKVTGEELTDIDGLSLEEVGEIFEVKF